METNLRAEVHAPLWSSSEGLPEWPYRRIVRGGNVEEDDVQLDWSFFFHFFPYMMNFKILSRLDMMNMTGDDKLVKQAMLVGLFPNNSNLCNWHTVSERDLYKVFGSDGPRFAG